MFGRWIAMKAENYLKSTGLADTAYFGAEAEFFIFDNISFDQNQHSSYYFIDAEEGRWNSGRRDNSHWLWLLFMLRSTRMTSAAATPPPIRPPMWPPTEMPLTENVSTRLRTTISTSTGQIDHRAVRSAFHRCEHACALKNSCSC